MKLRKILLLETARVRFPDAPVARKRYLKDVLRASEAVDAEHYHIAPPAFNALRAKYGERDRLDGQGRLGPPANGPGETPASPTRSAQATQAPEEAADRESALRGSVRAARRVAHAAHSIAKTSLGIDRASDEQIEVRLDVCRQCPGEHAIWKNGEVYTCGPMLESMKRAGQGTCGCILRKKARDLTENCPFGWWPTPAADILSGSG